MIKKMLNALFLIFFISILIPLNAFASGASDFVAVSLGIVAVIFLILREFFCWYWKINIKIALLSEIRDLLKANQIQVPSKTHSNNPDKSLMDQLKSVAGDDAIVFASANGLEWQCVCGKNNLQNSMKQSCLQCGRDKMMVLENYQTWRFS